MRKSPKFSPEVQERAVRMVFDAKDQYPSQWAAIESIASKIGCTGETLRKWVRQGERDSGVRPGATTTEQQRIKELEREVRELRKTNEILKLASAYFGPGGARPPPQEVNAFIDEHRTRLGVEPICSALQVAPSAYRRHAARQRDSALLPARAQRDANLLPQVQRVYDANLRVYGADKVWRQLLREGVAVARCTVERLMRRLGLQGVRRGKGVRTTVPDAKAVCPLDRVNRQFKAQRPNQLWVADFTYVSTWQGFVYVAFVVDVFARRIVGWRVSSSMQTDFVLDALEQALYARRAEREGDLVHHSDRGSQYVSIRYSERLAEAGIEPSVGSTGDSYDNALAETINGLYKAEIIHRRGPWKTREAVELATLEWVSWFNHHRLLEPIGYIPPAEAEANYWRQQAQGSASTKPARTAALQEG
ncbi:MAG: IS3 family transposase [Rhizobacter sp.]|nr:IS3 family transposase [Rhizobacter sp.]